MQFQPGDIVACYGTDRAAQTIRWGTWSLWAPDGLRLGPSHVAILCRYQQQMVWVESTTLCRHACIVNQRPNTGVQAHDPTDRINDYTSAGGHVDAYRLTDINRLSETESNLLTHLLIDHFVAAGLPYDLRGALLSGTRAFQMLRMFPFADLDELFCSELVAAVLMRLGRMNHANPTRFNPARLLRELVRIGNYHRVAQLTCEGELGV